MNSGSSKRNEIWGMIRTLLVNRAPIRDCSRDAGKIAAQTSSDQKVMEAVRALC
jgi:hypothetical protein